MKPAILLLAAAATIGAAPWRPAEHAAPSPRYEAGGFEPSWDLVIDGGWLTYDAGQADVPPTRVREPRRQPLRNGYRYVVSPELTITVRHVRCVSYPGRIYADTVYVTGIAEGGCGGRPVAPPTLAATDWNVGFIDGVPYGDGDVRLSFDWQGRVMTGSAGCSDFSVAYSERRPLLRFGRMTVTRRDCRGLDPARERRLLQMFTGTARMSWVDGDTLLLTSSNGIVRLPSDD